MKISDEQFKKVLQYINDELSPSEQEKFVQDMEQSNELALEVEIQRKIKRGLEINQIKRELEQLNKNLIQDKGLTTNKPPQSGRIIMFRRLAAAASVVLIIGVGYWWYANRQQDTVAISKPKEPKVVEKESKSTTNSVPNKPETKPQIDVSNYLREEVVLASPFSKDNFGTNPQTLNRWDRESEDLQLAIKWLKEGQTKQPISQLKQLQESTFTDISQVADWYLVLAYIKSNNFKQAKIINATIANNSSHKYQLTASKLEKSLK